MPGDSVSRLDADQFSRRDLFKQTQNQSINASFKSDDLTNVVTGADTTGPVNPEWKLMFGRVPNDTSQEVKSNTIRHRNSIRINASSNDQSSQQRNQQLFINQTHLPFKNCIHEVERYLDRSKFIYEDQMLKKKRIHSKDTINASINSNLVNLPTNANVNGKWKPKGYLIAHSNEHTKEINRLCRNSDSSYFASCSLNESSVKIWSTDNLLDVKSGFFKSIFTYDKQTSVARGSTGQENSSNIRPCCISFYDKNSLAILGMDFKFYVIDFNSSRTQYHLYTHEKLFKQGICRNTIPNSQSLSSPYANDKTIFYYLNKGFKNLNTLSKCSMKVCYCNSNYPIEMIYIDDSSPTLPIAASNLNDYYRASNVGSTSRGLFCYSTSIGDFNCIDLRTRTKAFEIRRDMKRGCITSMVTDPWYTWIGMGTSNGNIEIYDFRYMLPVQTFEHRTRTSVVKLCNHPVKSDRIVASYQGNNEIAIWNMNNMTKPMNKSSVKLNPNTDPEFVFWGVQSVPPLSQNKISNCYISGLMGVTSGEDIGLNALVCSSTDMKIRYIDLSENNKDSFVMSSPFNLQAKTNAENNPSQNKQTYEFANSLMSNNMSYVSKQIEGTTVLQELDQQSTSGVATVPQTLFNYPALFHQNYFTHHQDAITDLVICNTKSVPLTVTSSRDGALKIWR